jgi:hypothetical protein
MENDENKSNRERERERHGERLSIFIFSFRSSFSFVMDLDKRNFHLPKSMIPASGNERIPPEKSGDFPAAILLPRSVDFRCSPAGTGPYFSIWVELDGLSSKVYKNIVFFVEDFDFFFNLDVATQERRK